MAHFRYVVRVADSAVNRVYDPAAEKIFTLNADGVTVVNESDARCEDVVLCVKTSTGADASYITKRQLAGSKELVFACEDGDGNPCAMLVLPRTGDKLRWSNAEGKKTSRPPAHATLTNVMQVSKGNVTPVTVQSLADDASAWKALWTTILERMLHAAPAPAAPELVKPSALASAAVAVAGAASKRTRVAIVDDPMESYKKLQATVTHAAIVRIKNATHWGVHEHAWVDASTHTTFTWCALERGDLAAAKLSRLPPPVASDSDEDDDDEAEAEADVDEDADTEGDRNGNGNGNGNDDPERTLDQKNIEAMEQPVNGLEKAVLDVLIQHAA